MDDIQLILYIAFVLFAIVSRVLKRKKAGNVKKPEQREQNEAPPKPQISFEELLKEFTTGDTEKKEYDSEYRTEPEEVFELEYHDDEEAERVYRESVEASKKQAELVKETDDRHTGNFKHFRGYSEEDVEEEGSEFADLFHDQDSAKRAIILSEIINRKY
jgi:hypothetical protein